MENDNVFSIFLYLLLI